MTMHVMIVYHDMRAVVQALYEHSKSPRPHCVGDDVYIHSQCEHCCRNYVDVVYIMVTVNNDAAAFAEQASFRAASASTCGHFCSS